MRYLLMSAAALTLAACGGGNTGSDTAAEAATDTEELIEDAVELQPAAEAQSGPDWDAILASDRRGENDAARDGFRNPKETLAFFGIEPGMTVAETLPGGGWYTKILLPYLGAEGALIGVNYNDEMWPLFGDVIPPERVEAFIAWNTTWPGETNEWRNDGDAKVAGAYDFGSVSEEAAGSADAVLFIRALHNVNRFEGDGGYRTQALKDAFDLLKPGGIVGVVQHAAPEEADDAWANGAAGYLKKSQVIAMFEEAGFEFVEASELNANPKDQPTAEDIVWRLPPVLATSGDNPELADAMKAIGESNRMTLKFRKPS